MKKQLLLLLMVLPLLFGIFPVSALAAGLDAVETTPVIASTDELHSAENVSPADEPSVSDTAEPDEETAELMDSSGTCGNSLTWKLKNGTLTISGTGAMTNYSSSSSSSSSTTPAPWNASIKSIKSITIENSVTSIGDYAFYQCTNLTSITIGSKVTSIGKNAFQSCTSLTSVTIPDSVTSIGDYAFRNTGLTSVNIGNSVTSIGDYAFYYCKSLTSVNIGDSLTGIANYAFQSCTSMTSVNIGDSVTSIGSSAFDKCTSLTNVTIPDSVTSIGGNAFANCTSLTNVTIPDNVTYIGRSAFDSCKSLTSVTIPSKLSTFGTSAFANCTSLTNVTFSDGITIIGYCVFQGCTSLNSVTIPDSVTSITNGAFSGCTGLTNIMVSEENPQYTSSEDGILFNKDLTQLICYPAGKTETSYTIPDSVTSIAESAFSGCTGLTSITMPAAIAIGKDSFANCTEVAQVTLTGTEAMADYTTETYLYTPWYVSSNAGKSVQVTIEDGVTNIGDYAFYNCTGLTCITMPAAIAIGNDSFANCTEVAQVTLTGTGAMADYTTETYLYTPWYVSSNAEKSVQVTIEDGVTNIGDYAFYNCTGLTKIDIPNSVTSIGNSAFSECTGLTSITMPAAATIGKDSFADCTELAQVTLTGTEAMADYTTETYLYTPWYVSSNAGKSVQVTIEDGVTNIGDYAFYNCTGLTEIDIPNSVTSIDNSALAGCTGLTEIIIPENVTSIDKSVFAGCTGLTSITMPAAIDIGKDSFANCTAVAQVTLTGTGAMADYTTETYLYTPWYVSSNAEKSVQVTIEDGVTNIGDYAFYNCTGLTKIDIPNSVTSIGNSALAGCTSLTEIIIPNSVTSISNGTFSGCTGLTSITVSEENPQYTSEDGILFDENLTQLICYPAGKTETSYAIPDSVTSIGNSAFADCTDLTKIIIPNSVTSIAESAFDDCTGLTDVYYSGSKTDREIIDIASYNEPLLNAKWHYNYGVVGDISLQSWSSNAAIISGGYLEQASAIAASYDDSGRMTGIASGTIEYNDTDDVWTVTFSCELDVNWKLYFVQQDTFVPLYPSITLTDAAKAL